MIATTLSIKTIAFLDSQKPKNREEVKCLIECEYEEYFESVYDQPHLMYENEKRIDNLVRIYMELRDIDVEYKDGIDLGDVIN